MDRFITRIPKPPQNAVIDQIRAVQEVSSKQASAEKISHEFYKQYFLEYKWLQKKKMKIILQGLLNFFGCLEKETFTCDWVEGSRWLYSILYDMTSIKVTKNARKSMRASLELWPTEQAIQTFVKPCARS